MIEGTDAEDWFISVGMILGSLIVALFVSFGAPVFLAVLCVTASALLTPFFT